MVKRILGIDIGIASIGYALIEFNNEEENQGNIICSGVRIFNKAENPKDGKSLALPRREARSARRTIRRRAQRMKYIKNLFIENDLINQDKLKYLYKTDKQKPDPWQLRTEALERKLAPDELARVLTHIAKRRGYKSIRKTDDIDKKEGKVLEAISETKNSLIEKGYTTVGEMFYKDERYIEAKRNKAEDYKNTIPRELLEKEIEIIFEKQRTLGNTFATKDFEKEYCDIAFTQREAGSVASMVGQCTFEKTEKRAPKQSYSAELFTVMTKINNLVLVNLDGKTLNRFLENDEREILLEYCKTKQKVSLNDVRKKLQLNDNTIFKGVYYNPKEPDKAEKTTFSEMKGYYQIRKAIKNNCGEKVWDIFKEDRKTLDKIAEAITFEKSEKSIEEYLENNNIPDEVINAVKNLTMKNFIHISFKALNKILPHILEGYKYHESCIKAEYNHSNINSDNTKHRLLTVPEETTTNPVVNRAVAQFRKVVNAIIREHGSFHQMNIELARNLSHTFDERRNITLEQKGYQENKDKIKERMIKEFGISPDIGQNFLRFRLWEEQGGYCPYSNTYIEPKLLADFSYTDIDHIIPYSRSLDDSLNNKILCLASENKQKGNQIPFEYHLSRNDKNWDQFVARISSMNIKYAKKQKLLKLKFDKNDEKDFRERNINDTRYISRFIKDYVENNLEFADNGSKQFVHTRSGSLTAFLRHQWGLNKNRDESDKHHALDAIVVACATQGMVQYLSTMSSQLEGYRYNIKNQKPRFRLPWESFREDVKENLYKIFVSRAPRRKVTGEAHEETIRSIKELDNGKSVLKTPISKIKLKDLENLYNKEQNLNLYKTLKERLERFGDDPKKAFEEPIFMPISEEKIQQGIKPNQIKSVKICSPQKSGRIIRNGIANNANDSMVRVDVFSKPNKKGKEEFYLIPIYILDLLKPELPNKYIIANKPETEWLEVDDTFIFKFSLFKNDLVIIKKSEKNDEIILGYFTGCHRGTGGLTVISHDNSQKWEAIGSKKLTCFKKYSVDILGNIFEIQKEKRILNKSRVQNVLENSISK